MTCTTEAGPFVPHAGLSDEINRAIIQSEIEGGVFLDSLPRGALLEVETEYHRYQVRTFQKNRVLISGHPQFCPRPMRAVIHGSTWGGSMIKSGFIGRGMHLEFAGTKGQRITTSKVKEIRQIEATS